MRRRNIVLFTLIVAGFIRIAVAESTANNSSMSPEELFDFVSKSLCTIVAIDQDGNPASQGSGFVLRGTKLVVTNAHVLAGANSAMARCGDQIGEISKIVRYEPGIDAVIAEVEAVEIEGLAFIDNSDIRPGTQVYAFGSPLGLEGTISFGLASGIRQLAKQDYIQISAPVSPGSSGGPVTNQYGAVIGITVGSLQEGQNLNFAVPAWTIAALQSTSLKIAELGGDFGQQKPAEEETAFVDPQQLPDSELASFRGHVFGVGCGLIRDAELSRNPSLKYEENFPRGVIFESFSMPGSLMNKSVTIRFECDRRFGFVRGSYELDWIGKSFLEALVEALETKYGTGRKRTLNTVQAHSAGCDSSQIKLAQLGMRGSLETVSWVLADNLNIDFATCGTNELKLVYSNPALMQAIEKADRKELLDDI